MARNPAMELNSVALSDKDLRIPETESSVSYSPGSGDESSEKTNWHKGQESEMAFTIEILKSQLHGAFLSESWAWTRLSSRIVFTFFDRCNFQPQLHLEAALDLSMRVIIITAVSSFHGKIVFFILCFLMEETMWQ